MELAPNAIHLFCCHYLELDDTELLRSYRALLSDAEQAREARFHFARDRCCYLVTRALVRTILSRYADIAPRDWIFAANRHGRPEIANDDPAPRDPALRGLSFNVSHTQGLIVLAVARQRTLGVDTENLRARQPASDLADRYFAPQEVSSLRALPAEEQVRRFFEYWTLKEAYIKARGMGLSLPLDSFGFSFPGNSTIQFTSTGDGAGTHSPWQFWQMLLAPCYMTALCATRSDDPEPPILRKVVPLVSECALKYELLRISSDPL